MKLWQLGIGVAFGLVGGLFICVLLISAVASGAMAVMPPRQPPRQPSRWIDFELEHGYIWRMDTDGNIEVWSQIPGHEWEALELPWVSSEVRP